METEKGSEKGTQISSGSTDTATSQETRREKRTKDAPEGTVQKKKSKQTRTLDEELSSPLVTQDIETPGRSNQELHINTEVQEAEIGHAQIDISDDELPHESSEEDAGWLEEETLRTPTGPVPAHGDSALLAAVHRLERLVALQSAEIQRIGALLGTIAALLERRERNLPTPVQHMARLPAQLIRPPPASTSTAGLTPFSPLAAAPQPRIIRPENPFRLRGSGSGSSASFGL